MGKWKTKKSVYWPELLECFVVLTDTTSGEWTCGIRHGYVRGCPTVSWNHQSWHLLLFFVRNFYLFVWTFFLFFYNFPVVCVQKEQTINFELVILDVNLLLVGKKDVLNYFCFFFVPRYIMVCPLWRYVHACLLRLPIEGVNIRSFWGFHFHPPAVGVCVRVQFLLDAITSQSVFFLLDVNIL